MTTANAVLIDAKYAESAQTTQYTSAAPTLTIIDTFVAVNNSTSTTTFTVNIVPSGSSTADSNKLLDRSIAPSETYTCPEILGAALKSGDFISTIAGAANAITIRASGRIIE